MTPQEVTRLEELLRPPWIAVVATVGRNGMPQLTPNWYRFANSRLTITTTKERIKYRNLSSDTRIAVCICSEPQASDYATLWGQAEISDDESIWPETQAILARYRSSPERVDALMQEFRTQNRVIVSVVPEHVIFRT